jgi:hypothetical protein
LGHFDDDYSAQATSDFRRSDLDNRGTRLRGEASVAVADGSDRSKVGVDIGWQSKQLQPDHVTARRHASTHAIVVPLKLKFCWRRN